MHVEGLEAEEAHKVTSGPPLIVVMVLNRIPVSVRFVHPVEARPVGRLNRSRIWEGRGVDIAGEKRDGVNFSMGDLHSGQDVLDRTCLVRSCS
jgi:hypothetical protein